MDWWRWNLYYTIAYSILGMLVYGLYWTGTFFAGLIYDLIINCFFSPSIPVRISTLEAESFDSTLTSMVDVEIQQVEKVEKKSYKLLKVGLYCLVFAVLCITFNSIKPD